MSKYNELLIVLKQRYATVRTFFFRIFIWMAHLITLKTIHKVAIKQQRTSRI